MDEEDPFALAWRRATENAQPPSDESLSSTDAGNRERSRRRVQRHARRMARVGAPAALVASSSSPPEPLTDEFPLPGAVVVSQEAMDATPIRVDSIRNLLRDFPEMKMSTAQGSGGECTSFADDPDHNPFAVEACKTALQALPRPEYAMFPLGGRTDTPEMADAVARRALRVHSHWREWDLPILTANDEARLLGESGTFPWTDPSGRVHRITYPPCSHGNDCVGRRGGGMHRLIGLTDALRGCPPDHPGVILTAIVFPYEWTRQVPPEPQPKDARPCVLCYRILLSDYVYQMRWSGTSRTSAAPTVQLYANPVNTEGGYAADFVLRPQSPMTDYLTDACAEFRYLHLRMQRDEAQGGRWVVDQSDMIYRSMQQPQVAPVGAHLPVF